MMRIEGNSSPLSQQAPDSSLVRGFTAQTGVLCGERMMVEDAVSTLADAAEELSLYAAEQVKHKSLNERKIQAGLSPEIMQVEEIMAYLEAAKAFDDPQELVALAKRMQSGQKNPQELVRRESRDLVRQYVLLQYALQDGIANGIPDESLESLCDALADLEMESGPQIRCALNTIGVAAEFAADAESIAPFQSTYQDLVLGGATLAQTLTQVVERLAGKDGDDFGRGLQSLIKALGQDLAAARPSVDATRLQALVQDLYQLEVTATVMEDCRNLAASLASKHQCSGLSGVGLMKEMIAVTNEKWVSVNRFSSLAEKSGLREVGAQIAFLTAVKGMLRELPVKVYPDGDTRQSILNAVQEALDRAINMEEE